MIQPIDIPALLRAIAWPLLLIGALVVFRRPLRQVLTNLPDSLGRVRKFSVPGFSVEFSESTAVQPSAALDQELRQPEAGLTPQSGVPGLMRLLSQLQSGGPQDHIVIDLGTETSRRWLTSRLYILAYFLTLTDRFTPLVFLENQGAARKCFVGFSYPSRVRSALARRYGWLEVAASGSYAASIGVVKCAAAGALTVDATVPLPVDPNTGQLPEYQLSQLLQQFLALIRQVQPTGGTPVPPEWVSVGNQLIEHAKWVDGSAIERILGRDLETWHVILPANASLNDLIMPILQQRSGLVAVLDPDKTFRGLLDRSSILERFATEVAKTIGRHRQVTQ